MTRKHAPVIVTLATTLLIAIAILPSALTVPQSSPNTVPEYAPVPPRDENAPPPVGGNFSSLSLGSTSGLTFGGIQSLESSSKKPITKQCVGNPPRQTEDPMSPPCVPFFDGDNGGSTYFGVTRDEIRVVWYTSYGGEGTSVRCDAQNQCDSGMTTGSYCDFDKPPNTDRGCMPYNSNRDHWAVRGARALVKHFNKRYQTYGRHVHVWMFAGGLKPGQTSTSEADIRSFAAENYQKIKPFAVVPLSPNSYVDAMTSRNVLAFGNPETGAAQGSFFKKYNGLVWGFSPDIEHWAAGYVNYVCTKVKGRPVAHTDGLDTDGRPMRGKPRKYAFMHTTQASATNLHAFRDYVRPRLRECGINPETEVTFPVATSATYVGGDGGTYGASNVAKLRQHNVTTILWFGGQETYTGQYADQQRYYPEIVFAGDGLIDGILNGTAQQENWWRNAWGHTTALYQGETLEGQSQFQACKDGDPNTSRADCASGGLQYRNFFMLFKAIQSAGAKITPASIDRGLHSLPAIQSTHPMLASCYFDPDDFTCVKDGAEIWWDPDAQSAFWQGPGCFHMTYGASRFLPGTWPEDDQAFANANDPCSPALGGATVGAQNPSAPST